MSTLLLVRHGQTQGFLTGDYVDLTPHGRMQGAALGAWMAGQGITPDLVAVGPAPRHRQTLDAAREAGGWNWPEPVLLPELDEHAGITVVLHALQGGDVPSGLREAVASGDRTVRLRAFQQLMQAWIDGEVVVPGAEPWSAFRPRVAGAIDRLCGLAGKGSTVVAFTSGGFVGAAVASVLGVPSERTALDLAFAVANTSITEVRFQGTRRGLYGFNATPHLGDVVAVTAV